MSNPKDWECSKNSPDYTIKQARELASKLNISGRSKMDKKQLCQAIKKELKEGKKESKERKKEKKESSSKKSRSKLTVKKLSNIKCDNRDQDFKSYTKTDLHELAKELNIYGVSKLKKDQLCREIKKRQKLSKPEQKKTEKEKAKESKKSRSPKQEVKKAIRDRIERYIKNENNPCFENIEAEIMIKIGDRVRQYDLESYIKKKYNSYLKKSDKNDCEEEENEEEEKQLYIEHMTEEIKENLQKWIDNGLSINEIINMLDVPSDMIKDVKKIIRQENEIQQKERKKEFEKKEEKKEKKDEKREEDFGDLLFPLLIEIVNKLDKGKIKLENKEKLLNSELQKVLNKLKDQGKPIVDKEVIQRIQYEIGKIIDKKLSKQEEEQKIKDAEKRAREAEKERLQAEKEKERAIEERRKEEKRQLEAKEEERRLLEENKQKEAEKARQKAEKARLKAEKARIEEERKKEAERIAEEKRQLAEEEKKKSIKKIIKCSIDDPGCGDDEFCDLDENKCVKIEGKFKDLVHNINKYKVAGEPMKIQAFRDKWEPKESKRKEFKIGETAYNSEEEAMKNGIWFDPNSTFNLSEWVVVQRSSGEYQYGVIIRIYTDPREEKTILYDINVSKDESKLKLKQGLTAFNIGKIPGSPKWSPKFEHPLILEEEKKESKRKPGLVKKLKESKTEKEGKGGEVPINIPEGIPLTKENLLEFQSKTSKLFKPSVGGVPGSSSVNTKEIADKIRKCLYGTG